MDVSEIAKKYGGGGHRKAAGFTLPKSKHPDSLFEPEEIEYDDKDEFGEEPSLDRKDEIEDSPNT